MSERILYICQEISPYIAGETPMGMATRNLTCAMQERGFEIRTFMPRYGCVNERRHQLHEVIRLSGMNVIICDNDHQLIIKVASLQPSRLQVYFIDNDDFFTRKATIRDAEGAEFEDNDDRAIFFARGVIETVKKLRWQPGIVHCHGWFSAIAPLYIKHAFSDDPIFNGTKIVVSLHDDEFTREFGDEFREKIAHENAGIENGNLENIGSNSYQNLMKLVIDYADGVVFESENVNLALKEYVLGSGKPVLDSTAFAEQNEFMDAYQKFYNEL
ncbi:MAG: glycogen/starch synthase [Rikenellaceae bacterium]|nr:glycogen/starch synthase [Rikenellaceae bacterium]